MVFVAQRPRGVTGHLDVPLSTGLPLQHRHCGQPVGVAGHFPFRQDDLAFTPAPYRSLQGNWHQQNVPLPNLSLHSHLPPSLI